MPAALGFWDYVKAAFKQRAKVPLLGHVPVNYLALMAVAVLGLINPGIWFLGIALEIAYLAFMASSGRYQKLVQGLALVKEQAGSEQRVQQTVTLLSPPAAERYRRLADQCRLILGINAPLSATGMLEDMRAGSLNQLLWLFLRLLSSREMLLGTLNQVDRRTLESDVSRTEQKLQGAQPDTPLHRSLQATLEIQQRRLENLSKAKGSLEVIDAELERIEQQVRLIREESAVSGSPEILSARLDAVTSTLSETSKWMDQHAELLGTLSGDEALGAAPPRLPSIPSLPAAPPAPPAGKTPQKE
jgi:hypothetical protein